MFGYVKPDKPELKIKEYETYKAVYCSVCRTLGKHYGILSRFLLTYDSAFYVIVLKCLLQSECDCAERGVCRFNPLKKCHYIPEDELLRRAAALTVIMFYYKLLDDLEDGRGPRKLLCYILLPFVKNKFKKAVKDYSQFDGIISLSMKKQAQTELNKDCSVDRACDPSATALGEIFSYGVDDGELRRVLYRIGYCVGRWVYLADAFDDLEKDVKSGSFNPFAAKYGLERETVKNLDDEVIDGISASIRLTANEAASAFDLAQHKCYSPIAENIIYDGMENELINIIHKKRGVKK